MPENHPIQIGDVGQSDPLDIGARATTVLPKLEQLGYLVQTEARIPGLADEAQRVPLVISVESLGPADMATKSYLETEADLDAYLAHLKTELLVVIRAGQKARVQ